MKRLICYIVLIYPLWGLSQNPYQLIQTENEIPLNDHLSILADPEKNLELADIKENPSFETYHSDFLPHPRTVYWGRIQIKNQLDEPSSWMFYPDWKSEPEQNEIVDVYVNYRDSTIGKKSGRFIPASQKDVAAKPGNKVSIELAALQSVTLYFRLEKINPSPPVINARLVEKSHWNTFSQEERNVREAIVQGMLWMILLYSFTIFLGTWEKTYLLYTLFLLSASIYFLYLSGILMEVFFQEVPKVNTYLRIIVSNLLPWAFMQFSRTFVDTKNLIPRWDRVTVYILRGIIVWMILELLITIVWFHGPLLNFMIDLAFLLEGIFLLVIVIRFFFTPFPIARIFIFGTLFMAIAAFIGVSADIFFEVQPFLGLIEFAFIIQVLTFALGLSFKLQLGEKVKLAAQKELNERLIQTDKLKDTFLANTSHELRTPLTGILGLSENLHERYDQIHAEKARKDLEMIISSTKRLTHLVNDLLDFSKLKNDDLILHPKEVDLHTLVAIVLYIHQPLVSGKKLHLINGVDANLPNVWADENRLQQILFNLVGNAVKFTESGSIEVEARQEGKEVLLSVTDTGIGIPADKLESIFKEFEQADGSIQRQYAGTGLGLSITQKLVTLHGGNIEVFSTEGTGSRFQFKLPIASPNQVKSTQSTPLIVESISALPFTKSPLYTTQQLQGPSILIVDDEPINHQVLRNHLEEEAYTLYSAMNGQEALDLIQQGVVFDLVLLDVMMPKMSGYEWCELIRKTYLPSELPIIMVTAKNQVADLIDGLSAGANDYLTKPFTKAELLARLRTQVYLHQIHRVTNRFVPREFIHSLGLGSMLDLKLGDHIARTVTVFFLDIRGYTSLAETMTPDENFRFVNAFTGKLGPIIKRHKGFVHQYLGDCIMAIFLENAANSLQAAISMQKAIYNYNKDREGRGRQSIQVGMGMHTGELIMGIIGDTNRTEAATISDTVNTASRMEGLTKFFGSQILLSEDSVKQIEEKYPAHSFHLRFLGKVQVKGRKEAVGVYECFDTDPSDQFQLKAEYTPLFQQALAAYFEKDFVRAAARFKEIRESNPSDKAAFHYLVKSSKFLVEGVAPSWTGVETMSSK